MELDSACFNKVRNSEVLRNLYVRPFAILLRHLGIEGGNLNGLSG
jgi:hypothetical protein